jgi:hypothetical protein
MEQHPVPQPISSYEFRLIGSMTLKQFAKLAACCLVALIFYALPLPAFLKWPGIVFFALLGIGLAFLPINERPLDVWIISFLKAVFSPTQYIWKKETPLPVSQPKFTPPVISQSVPQPQVQPQPPPPDKEAEFLKNIQSLFTTVAVPKPKVEFKPPVPPRTKKAVTPKLIKDNLGPFTPSLPNIISGVIKDKEGNLIEGAILEIRDLQGNPLRALKSNKLGQFRIATPLPNGTYEIITEKDGLDFDIIKINLIGEIIQPIEIIPT